MLKITKGLKKKKKGKKGKRKEEELFEEAELEQYRKEQEEKRRQQAEAGETVGEGDDTNKPKGEEWEKFKALTSGVDSILKKTQGDLDRIKSTSYFQRKPTASELAAQKEKEEQENREKNKDKSWVGFSESAVNSGKNNSGEVGENQLSATEISGADAFAEVNFEEDTEDEDDEDDIFDTSYVDAVASGEVKLAYIPDSPTEDEDGYDPFDTSIVDKVIKETPADKKKKNLVSLGSAVEVLTGKVDRPITPVFENQKRSPRRQKPRDLLLGSFDEGDQNSDSIVTVSVSNVEEPAKTLLDDDPLGEDIKVDLSVNLAPIVASITPSPLSENRSPTKDVPEIKTLVSEFDCIQNNFSENKQPNCNLNNDGYDIDDEFAILAAESLTKEVNRVSPLTVLESSNNFESTNQRIYQPNLFETDKGVFKENYQADPFDTSFAADIVPGKYELKLIEEEILNKDIPTKPIPIVNIKLPKSGTLKDPLAIDEHNLLEDDQRRLSYKHRDLLGGSTTDLSKISHSPIEPAPITNKVGGELSYCDPFDTSIVSDLVAPGKAELKFLEKVLLAEGPSTSSQVVEDDEFNPRADSPIRKKSIPRPEQLFIGENKRQSIPKVVAFKVASPEQLPDLLSAGATELSKASKPLTPYYPEPKLLKETKLSCESEQDPFDTSFVSSTPGKHELKLIENEFAGEDPTIKSLRRSVCDPDFDPRALDAVSCQNQNVICQDTHKNRRDLHISKDILSEDVKVDTKLHTPVVPKKIEEIFASAYEDPFDTSIAQHILPGKAELKLLESELIDSNVPATTIKRSYTDPEFDPRLVEEQPPKNIDDKIASKPANLDFTEHPIVDEVTEKPLTPLSATFTSQELDIDPFDTSCIVGLVPGKVELKLLESELIHN